MNIFLSHAYTLSGQERLAGERFENVRIDMQRSAYWTQRIESFKLANLFQVAPVSKDNVFGVMKVHPDRFRGEIEERTRTSGWNAWR